MDFGFRLALCLDTFVRGTTCPTVHSSLRQRPARLCQGAGEGARFAEPAALTRRTLLSHPPHCPSVPSPPSAFCPRGPIKVCSWPRQPSGQALATSPCQLGQGLRWRPAHLGWLPRGGLLRWWGGGGRGVTCICRHCHRAGCIQNSLANALAAGGRLLLSPNSSTQSIINTSPKAQRRHYRGSASHSGHHLLSRLQKLGK